jgi:hypothetical protein
MRQHRRTQNTVSNNLHDDKFNPSDGLENLHTAILRVHTLVHVANKPQMSCAVHPHPRLAALSRGC